jgi:hypothetical protein
LKPIKSQSIDFQIGYEKGISAALAAVSGASVVNVHGGMHVELTYHPVQAVLDDDILGMRGRFMEGVRVTDEMLAVDVIEEVARSRASSWLMPTPGNGGKKNSICPRSPPDHPILNGSSRARRAPWRTPKSGARTYWPGTKRPRHFHQVKRKSWIGCSKRPELIISVRT